MRILAIDAALPAVSACVVDSAEPAPLSSESIEMTRGHAEALMPLIERVVRAAPGGFGGLDRIAVTVGPGSFTGIRVGLAAASGIARALGKPAVGVSTLAAFAAPLILARVESPIVACIDARHGRFYAQMFSGAGKPLDAPGVYDAGAIAAMASDQPCRVTGEGASAVAAEIWARGGRADVTGRLASPAIAFVAMLGLMADPDAGDGGLHPMYLKAVDATPMAVAPAAVQS